MISLLVIHPDPQKRVEKILETLSSLNLTWPHHSVNLYQDDEKLGIEDIRKLQDFLSLKPYQGSHQVVAIVSADKLSTEAQNSLLKSLEEPFENTLLILGATSESTLLPTITSRCQTIRIDNQPSQISAGKNIDKFKTLATKFIESKSQDRFYQIEKLDDREEFLSYLIHFSRNDIIEKLRTSSLPAQSCNKVMADLLMAEVWQNQNVTPRAILEYLALKI